MRPQRRPRWRRAEAGQTSTEPCVVNNNYPVQPLIRAPPEEAAMTKRIGTTRYSDQLGKRSLIANASAPTFLDGRGILGESRHKAESYAVRRPGSTACVLLLAWGHVMKHTILTAQ